MTNTRSCDALGCSAAVSSGRFMCIRHWRMVPVETQRTINTRYRACRADFAFLSDIAYLQACVDALSHIAGVERLDPAPSTYDRLLRQAQRQAAS